MAEDVTPEDLALLKLLKTEVKETPKGDKEGDLKEWMMQYLATSTGVEPKKEKTEETKFIPIAKHRDPPKLTNFSGINNKGETTYELWRYEVCGLMSDKLCDPENINYAVRRSLKGDAGVTAMHLGPHAGIPEIIEKLDSIYGDLWPIRRIYLPNSTVQDKEMMKA